jgi:hypothetical protein
VIAHALEKFRDDLPALRRAHTGENELWTELMRHAEAIVDPAVTGSDQEQAIDASETLFVEAGLKNADEPEQGQAPDASQARSSRKR